MAAKGFSDFNASLIPSTAIPVDIAVFPTFMAMSAKVPATSVAKPCKSPDPAISSPIFSPNPTARSLKAALTTSLTSMQSFCISCSLVRTGSNLSGNCARSSNTGNSPFISNKASSNPYNTAGWLIGPPSIFFCASSTRFRLSSSVFCTSKFRRAISLL